MELGGIGGVRGGPPGTLPEGDTNFRGVPGNLKKKRGLRDVGWLPGYVFPKEIRRLVGVRARGEARPRRGIGLLEEWYNVPEDRGVAGRPREEIPLVYHILWYDAV